MGLLGSFSENTKEILAIGFVHSGPKDHILEQSDKTLIGMAAKHMVIYTDPEDAFAIRLSDNNEEDLIRCLNSQ